MRFSLLTALIAVITTAFPSAIRASSETLEQVTLTYAPLPTGSEAATFTSMEWPADIIGDALCWSTSQAEIPGFPGTYDLALLADSSVVTAYSLWEDGYLLFRVVAGDENLPILPRGVRGRVTEKSGRICLDFSDHPDSSGGKPGVEEGVAHFYLEDGNTPMCRLSARLEEDVLTMWGAPCSLLLLEEALVNGFDSWKRGVEGKRYVLKKGSTRFPFILRRMGDHEMVELPGIDFASSKGTGAVTYKVVSP